MATDSHIRRKNNAIVSADELDEGSDAKEFPRHVCEEARHNGIALLSKYPSELHAITDNTFVQLDTKSKYNGE
ncbi:hypothetical protein chiPu_0005486 [Chiloscyllium punctatum]|uniref:Uncharacterized protein n=1 Tax=Chiloscyllium punctatum TaxID=137246 RepID=A0A401S9I9_CHIPU|nr:hypothetical protein [Chiloscyllium punctatum]